MDKVLQDVNSSQLYATPYTVSLSVNGQNLNCSSFKKDFQLKMSFLNAHGAYTSVLCTRYLSLVGRHIFAGL